MPKKTHFQEVYSRIYRMTKMSAGKYGVFYIAANILGTIVYFFVQYFRLGEIVAKENLLDGLILLGAINLCLLILAFPYIRFWVVPEEIYDDQREIIDSHTPNQLNIFVGGSPGLKFNRWYIKDDVVIHIACLTVISHEKKKIVEFHAKRLDIVQKTPVTDYSFGTYEPDLKFEWKKDRKVFTKLIPGEQDQLILAELNPEEGYPVFGQSKIFSHEGKKPSIYEVYIQFKGKREKETDFAYYNYRTEIYCHPAYKILDFAEDSIDIPDDLKSKVLFSKRNNEKET